MTQQRLCGKATNRIGRGATSRTAGVLCALSFSQTELLCKMSDGSMFCRANSARGERCADVDAASSVSHVARTVAVARSA